MHLLITGAEGFVGRNLAEAFRERGLPILAPPRRELDLLDEIAVEKYLAHHSIDTVIHCATTERIGTVYPENTCEMNLRMFFNLQRRLRPGQRLINLGSGSEYSRKHWHRKMPETFFDVHVPPDGHSYAKYLISKFIEETGRPEYISLRIFGIYGRYEDYRYKFVSNAIVKNLLGMPIVINQNVMYDYLYITDFIRIVEKLLAAPKWPHRSVNVTPDAPIDLVTLARLINEVSDHPSELQVLHAGLGTEYSGDNTRLLETIGGFSFLDHREAIADLTRYYLGIRNSLDVEAIRRDAYLDYAKNLKATYFDTSHAESDRRS